jgi:Cu+-exporting ATPase
MQLGIRDFHAEKLPEEKLGLIAAYAGEKPTAMVGDGINDAPALAKATIGISLSNASQAAMQSAQIILLNGRLDYLPKALAICRHTVLTIRQSLGWAFAYNIVAIPIAAIGLLNPMWGALFMAFSDIVVIGNAVWLQKKNIPGVGKG